MYDCPTLIPYIMLWLLYIYTVLFFCHAPRPVHTPRLHTSHTNLTHPHTSHALTQITRAWSDMEPVIEPFLRPTYNPSPLVAPLCVRKYSTTLGSPSPCGLRTLLLRAPGKHSMKNISSGTVYTLQGMIIIAVWHLSFSRPFYKLKYLPIFILLGDILHC